jgi:hypothetical protein
LVLIALDSSPWFIGDVDPADSLQSGRSKYRPLEILLDAPMLRVALKIEHRGWKMVVEKLLVMIDAILSSILNPPSSILCLQSRIPATFSFGVLFTLIAILLLSGRVFYVLTRQWTTHRPVEALQEWASDQGFKLQIKPKAKLPPALSSVENLQPEVEITLAGGAMQLIRLSTDARPASPRPTWNLLIHESAVSQTPVGLQPAGLHPTGLRPAGLRPATASSSFLDLFSLSGFPSLLPPDRFVVFATEAKDARAMAASPARGLLPADIGFMVYGPYTALDFSTRPFDTIEFDRMRAILEQLVKVQM